MQCHPSLYYVIYLGKLSFAVPFDVFISLLWLFIVYVIYCLLSGVMVYIYCLLSFFSDAGDNEES